MEKRIALIGIIVKNSEKTNELNALLHSYGKYIIGRMGVPYKENNLSIISIAVDGEQSIISALSGKLGRIDGINVKTLYADVS